MLPGEFLTSYKSFLIFDIIFCVVYNRCGHCKRLAPTWEELGIKFIDSTTVKIAKVDCTDESNRQLCVEEKVKQKFFAVPFYLIINTSFSSQVNGFPTMFLYQDGKKVEEYEGNRSLEDLFSFISKNTKHDEL